LAHTRQKRVHWQRVIDNAATFRQLLGDHLDQLSFEERQAVAQCLINKVVVTGEEVDVQFILPFESTPQVSQCLLKEPEGTPGHVYRLRLAHFQVPLVAGLGPSVPALIGIPLAELVAPLPNRFVRHRDAAGEEELFHVAIAEAKPEIEADGVADDLGRKAIMLVWVCWHGGFHRVSMPHRAEPG
jgi:hypothetical protein